MIAALLQGKTVAAGANDAQISLRTARRYCADPAFRQRLQDAREAALASAISCLVSGSTSAAAQLRLLANGAEQEHIRLAACRSVLELAIKGIELLSFAERLSEVERRLGIEAGGLRVVGGRQGSLGR